MSVGCVISLSDSVEDEVPRRFVRAETVLAGRTSHIVLVMDSIVDSMNTQAVCNVMICGSVYFQTKLFSNHFPFRAVLV